jgi:hypothetical protein
MKKAALTDLAYQDLDFGLSHYQTTGNSELSELFLNLTKFMPSIELSLSFCYCITFSKPSRNTFSGKLGSAMYSFTAPLLTSQ